MLYLHVYDWTCIWVKYQTLSLNCVSTSFGIYRYMYTYRAKRYIVYVLNMQRLTVLQNHFFPNRSRIILSLMESTLQKNWCVCWTTLKLMVKELDFQGIIRMTMHFTTSLGYCELIFTRNSMRRKLTTPTSTLIAAVWLKYSFILRNTKTRKCLLLCIVY